MQKIGFVFLVRIKTIMLCYVVKEKLLKVIWFKEILSVVVNFRVYSLRQNNLLYIKSKRKYFSELFDKEIQIQEHLEKKPELEQQVH